MTEKDNPSATCDQLIAQTRSLQLATVGADGFPHCGYTPFVVRDNSEHETDADAGARCFYIFISELALHTRDLMANPRASIMIIADEAQSSQIFARTRVYYECEAQQVTANDEGYKTILDQYQERHGKMVGLLRGLPDFRLFRLNPKNGQFVMGFGKAFKLAGANLRDFEHSRRA